MQLYGLEHLRDKKNLLGFSAGVDSTALFFLLLDLDISFDVVMVNYHIRAQSDLEVEYAKELCVRYDKKFFLLDSPRIDRDFENRARQIRYEFFDSVIVENGYENLILAHQLNDRLEWFLMQLLRGGSLGSMLGFSFVDKRFVHHDSYQVVRPLWEVSRDEILTFLHTRGIKFFQDSSNDDERFFRNHIRKNYANSLMKENSQGIIKSFRHLRDEHAKLYATREMAWIAGVCVIKKESDQTNIYFVDSTDIESAAMILYLINRYNNPSFIVSRDLLNAQAVACTNKTMMLYPSKFKGEDRSLSIPADKESMMISFLIMYRNRKSYDSLKGYAAKLNMISPDFFPLIMAMSGYEKRDISCIVNHVKTLKSIIDGILNGNLPNFFTYDTNQILNFLRASKYVHSEDHFKIISNYMALDMVTQSIAVNESIAAQKNILIDLHDTGEIQKINDIYFKNNPIDINRL